mmetsp:Transcript_70314/g.183071  ORF Transcript_70314/g.183071 Transcript_70314/m.183071 type:complete len:157 (-) Transcript_70314:20-490(-)
MLSEVDRSRPADMAESPDTLSASPSSAELGIAAVYASAAFVVVDRMWWCALLGACYRRAPLELLASTRFGPRALHLAESAIGPSRLQRICAWLEGASGRLAGSRPGQSIQRNLQLDPKRLVLVLPQSIALYNVCLPAWLPLNGWMAKNAMLRSTSA